MQPGKLGVWWSTNALSKAQLVELAQGVERLNYSVFWYPESMAYESLAMGGFLLGQTERLCLASGIANMYARDALTARAGHDTLNSLYNDRFILRGEHGTHIEELVEDWTLTHTRQEITDWGQANHHPWGPVTTSAELLDNEQLWERGFYSIPTGGENLVYPGAPYKLSESGWQLVSEAPQVGQHNSQVYCEELGLSADELQGLIKAGVV